VPFRTLGRIRASVVTEGTNISQLRFPTCQIPQKTGCQGGQGSPRAVAPSEEEEEEEEEEDFTMSGDSFPSTSCLGFEVTSSQALTLKWHTLLAFIHNAVNSWKMCPSIRVLKCGFDTMCSTIIWLNASMTARKIYWTLKCSHSDIRFLV
jgi:hypothetical protein